MSAIRLSSNRLDLGSASLTNAEMRGWSETVNALGNVTGATTIDLSSGNVITATTTGATTWTVTNTSSTQVSSFTLILTNGGSATQTWMSGTQWANGIAPTLNSSGTDVLTFFTTDAGTVWRASKGGPTPSDQTGQKLFMWGAGGSGQLGLGDTPKRSSPVQLAGQWAALSFGNNFSLALKGGGVLWGWGEGSSGQFGLGDTVSRSSPVQAAPGTWVALKSGYDGAMGLKADGTLFSWGSNALGKLGLGDTVNRSSPVQISGTWDSLHGFTLGSVAKRGDGTMWVWGPNYSGQLGLGDTVRRSSPVQLAGNWRTVISNFPSGGAFNLLGIRTDGTLWAWGKNTSGELGIGSTVVDSHSSPVQVGTGLWRAVMKTGAAHMAIRHDGTLWSWGVNGDGRLGLGDTVVRSSPVQVGSELWSTSSPGYNSSFAVRPDGSLFSWGQNTSYLGLGDTVKRSSPTQVSGTWVIHVGGGFHSGAFKF